MTFLNATLIFGMAAIAAPIVLHLIARREPRKVVFPSVRFLTRRFESNRSRLRVRRWWLLALRIAAIAALALALARPAIHRSLSITWLTIGLVAALGVALLVMASVALARRQSQATAYGLGGAAALALLAALVWGSYTYASGPAPAIDSIEPVAIAIVLDNSPTSAWKTAEDDRVGRMRDLATWMVTRVPRTSRIAIIDRSSQVANFSLDVASALSKIEQIQPLEVTQPISSRLDAAARLVRTSELPNRQVLLVTDLAESTWREASDDAGLANLFAQDPPVALTLFDLGEFEGSNRSLSIPRFADATPPRGVPVAVSSTLEFQAVSGSAAESPASASVTAELQMYKSDPAFPVVRDGVVLKPALENVDRTSVRVAAGGASELLLTVPALDVGTHHGRIQLVGDDAMPLDDVRYFTLQVLAPSNLLLVSDDEDEARIISQAITAAPGLIDEADAEFIVQRISFADLSVVRLGDFDAVILLDPPREVLGDDAVTEFAQDGGGVFIGLGPAAGEGAFDSPLLPPLVRRWRTPDPGTFFQVNNSSHGVTQSIAADTPWSDFRVQQYWQLEASENDTILIEYAGSEHPALVERLFRGDQQSGRVLVLSTPIPALAKSTRRWNELFGSDPWPAWLMTRQSVEYLTRRGGAQWMAPVGRPQSIPIEENVEPDENRAQRLQLFPPGETLPVPLNVPEGATKVTIGDVPRSGIYWIRGARPGIGFSANLPGEAIKIGRIEPATLDQIFGPDQYSLAIDRQGIEFAENKATQRVALQSPAMLLALVVFLLEQILGNRFYRKS